MNNVAKAVSSAAKIADRGLQSSEPPEVRAAVISVVLLELLGNEYKNDLPDYSGRPRPASR